MNMDFTNKDVYALNLIPYKKLRDLFEDDDTTYTSRDILSILDNVSVSYDCKASMDFSKAYRILYDILESGKSVTDYTPDELNFAIIYAAMSLQRIFSLRNVLLAELREKEKLMSDNERICVKKLNYIVKTSLAG